MNQPLPQEPLQKMIAYARKYYSFGWSLLPVHVAPDQSGKMVKKPVLRWAEFQRTRAPWEEIERWVRNGWGLGLIHGNISGTTVVDDDRHKIQENYLEGLTSSIIARTKSGGFHFFYCFTPEVTTTSNSTLRVDIRSEGGFTVLPPFFGYAWEPGFEPSKDNREALKPLPIELFRQIKPERSTIEATFDEAEIQGLKDGQGRHDALFSFSCSMWRRELPKDVIWKKLVQTNAHYIPPIPEADLLRIFERGKGFISGQKLEESTTPFMDGSKKSIEEIVQFKKREEMPLGVPKIDDQFRFPTGYYVVCGQPGSGKGFFASWLARRFWERYQKKSIFFSLEMSSDLVFKRMLQQWSDLTQQEFELGTDVTPVAKLIQQNVFVPIEFGLEKEQSIEQFLKDVEFWHGKGYRIFFFDHLHEISGSIGKNSNFDVIETWGKAFQEVAKKYPDIWLIVFAQPNGASEQKVVLTKNDTMGSKSIGQKCEYFISINPDKKRDETTGQLVVDKSQGKVFWYLDKNRTGSVQNVSFTMYFSKTGNFFASDYECHANSLGRIRLPETKLEKDIVDELF